MTSTGKIMRMRRLIDRETGTSFMFAMSHGTSAAGFLEGLERTREMVGHAIREGANVVFLSRGYAVRLADLFKENNNASLSLKVSASAANAARPHQELPISTVEEALRLGADSVVALVPLAPDNEPDVISWVAKLGEDCTRLGMPFIAEAEYPASYGQRKPSFEMTVDYLKRSARLSEELGADIVKSNWTGSTESFREIVKSVQVPVVVAGGSKESEKDLLTKLVQAREAGAIGCSVGRNIFQHHNPAGMARAISKVVKGKATVDEALKELQKSH